VVERVRHSSGGAFCDVVPPPPFIAVFQEHASRRDADSTRCLACLCCSQAVEDGGLGVLVPPRKKRGEISRLALARWLFRSVNHCLHSHVRLGCGSGEAATTTHTLGSSEFRTRPLIVNCGFRKIFQILTKFVKPIYWFLGGERNGKKDLQS